MEKELYRIDGVGYDYGGKVEALRGVSFTVGKGESLAILGANGSGKSTLLKILDGLVFPSSGRVTFGGRELTEEALAGEFLKYFREKVGFIFSEPEVQLFSPTVYEDIAFGPLQLDMPPEEVKTRVTSILRLLGIEALKERAPYTLSSGEKKKVAVASVLALNPSVLLLDEPTNGLDPRSQVWLLGLLTKLKEMEKTFIIATHDLSLVEDFCARTIVLSESHSVAGDGPTREILLDRDLLLRVNVIHEHDHRHGEVTHRHSHGPFSTHDDHE